MHNNLYSYLQLHLFYNLLRRQPDLLRFFYLRRQYLRFNLLRFEHLPGQLHLFWLKHLPRLKYLCGQQYLRRRIYLCGGFNLLRNIDLRWFFHLYFQQYLLHNGGLFAVKRRESLVRWLKRQFERRRFVRRRLKWRFNLNPYT